jgi:hypothetical protein
MVAGSHANAPASKLIVCVIDAMAPAPLERAISDGSVPTLAALIERGRYVNQCAAAFPSVTPVCAASIMTGVGPDRHGIPGMNWYDRGSARYVEYGSSLRAAQRFGIAGQLTDTVYNLNQVHLSAAAPTVFELLDDADVRTAGTTYLVYRGRYRHEPRRDGWLTRLAAPFARHPVLGPREFFYADIFASQPAPCSSILGMPGIRDRHSGCVGEYLLEHDLADFLLLSLPDNDWYSHKHGPAAQVHSLARADLQLARVADAVGGLDALLEDFGVIVLGDHAHAAVDRSVDLVGALSALEVAGPRQPSDGAAIAVCPSQRAAMVYVLDPVARDSVRRRVVQAVRGLAGIDLACWMEYDAHDRPVGAVVASAAGAQLRFAPGEDVRDLRGGGWSVDGGLEAFEMVVRDGVLHSPRYPDGLARLWSALMCEHAGDVLLSAASGYEFSDWGGQAHGGGGSHGSLEAQDSLTGLIMCGVQPPASEPGQWTIRDVAPIVAGHFGIELPTAPVAQGAV